MTPATPNAAASETDLSARGPLSLLLHACAEVADPKRAAGHRHDDPALYAVVPGGLPVVHLRAYAGAAGDRLHLWVGGPMPASPWRSGCSGASAARPLRGLGLMMVGTIFWNVGVLAGLVCIVFGEATSIPFLQMPAYIHPLLLVAYAAIATPGILAWTGRHIRETFAAQWYAVAALFLFPWLYSVAQVMLLGAPRQRHGAGRGRRLVLPRTSSACGSSRSRSPRPTISCRRLTGHTINNYHYAPHGSGRYCSSRRGRAGGTSSAARCPRGFPRSDSLLLARAVPFPGRRPSTSARACTGGRGSNVLGFISLGLLAYLAGGLADAVFSFQGFARVVQFTYFPVAQLKLALLGAFSLPIFGAIYYLVPRITGVAWPSAAMIRLHFRLTVLGLFFTVIGWPAPAGHRAAASTIRRCRSPRSRRGTRPWLHAAAAGEGLLLLGSLVLGFHFVRQQAAAFGFCPRSSAALEAAVSEKQPALFPRGLRRPRAVVGGLALGTTAQLGALTPYYDKGEDRAFPDRDPGIANRGRLVYEDLGCAACHTPSRSGGRVLAATPSASGAHARVWRATISTRAAPSSARSASGPTWRISPPGRAMEKDPAKREQGIYNFLYRGTA